ncbi:MAG: right-handed parallel beta-helix repeat-containing protein [Spirochaetes bacterium]|nr:right-handed parallel beta-helix repeat-containing protein [Spirochaetota bacterium]
MLRTILLSGFYMIVGVFVYSAQFDITAYGAKADGTTMNTASVQRAVDACSAAGGGRVVIPAGVFLTAGILLKDNVTLYLEAGATLRAPRELSQYDNKQRIFIAADSATNIGIAGPGILDGSGDAFWVKDEKYREKKDTWSGASHNAWKAIPRPSNIRISKCRGVSVMNVMITNSPSWTLHVSSCDNVIVDNVTIRNPLHGPNTDGIDINMCREVMVANCDISTGDDAIVLKATSAADRRVSRNITVSNCRIETECQAFKIGTETLDGFENIVFRDSFIYNRSSDPGERASAGIALEAVDGGTVNGVVVSNIVMTNVRAPIFIRLGNRGNGQPAGKKIPGALKNVVIENITAYHSLMESSVTGIPGYRVENVTLRNIDIELEGGGEKAWAAVAVKEAEDSYPAPRMFGVRLPAYGFFCRHVKGLSFSNVRFRNLLPDARPVLYCDDVETLAIDNFIAGDVSGDEALMRFVNVVDATVTKSPAPRGAKLFLKARGAMTKRIMLGGNSIDASSVDAEDTIRNEIQLQ